VAQIGFTEDAVSDLDGLDGAVLKRVLAKIRLLRDNHEAGQPLGSRQVSNLTGFRKLLVANRQYRIIYKTEQDGSVCVVWVVAARTDDEAYRLAEERLHRYAEGQPAIHDLETMISMLRLWRTKD
jgi:mRNA interferase RelE/StbE